MDKRNDHNGIIIAVTDQYASQFKGGKSRNIPVRRPTRPPLETSVRQAAKQLLNSLRFTARDEALLNTLLGVGLLSQQQIRSLFFASANDRTTNSRLKQLYDAHLLDFTAGLMPRMAEAGMQPCYLYALGPVGEEILAIRRGVSRSALGLSDRYDLHRGNPLLMHDLQVSHIYVQAKVAARPHNGGVVWGNEQAAAIRNQTGQELVRPDGLLDLTIGRQNQTFFVELDRGSSHWPDKINFYETARRRGEWQSVVRGDTFPTVLSVVADRFLTRARRAAQNNHAPIRFLFKSWSAFLAEPFFSNWHLGGEERLVNLFPEM
jgi:hypothetical protein